MPCSGAGSNERAKTYRRINHIDDRLGTAVNVQAMVFGNLGENSRHRRRLHAQSRHRRERVLRRVPDERAGRRRRLRRAHSDADQRTRERHAQGLRPASQTSPGRWKSTIATCRTSSSPSRMASSTCCRPATASAPASRLFASRSTWCAEGLITQEEAIFRVEPNQLYDFLVPRLDEKGEKVEVLATGLPASPGAAVGQIVFTAEDAVKHHQKGEIQDVILVRGETTPEDIPGMEVAAGILTSRGGMTSHAAVVTRGMGKCCVAGAGDCTWTRRRRKCG